MVHTTKENGSLIRRLDKDAVHKFGLMVQCMKVIGLMEKLVEEVDLFMQTVMFMMDIGKMIKHMDLEFTHI